LDNVLIALISGSFVLIAAVIPQLIGATDRRKSRMIEELQLSIKSMKTLARKQLDALESYYKLEQQYAELVTKQTGKTFEAVKREQRKLLKDVTGHYIDPSITSPGKRLEVKSFLDEADERLRKTTGDQDALPAK
jgi:hypothetical protein